MIFNIVNAMKHILYTLCLTSFSLPPDLGKAVWPKSDDQYEGFSDGEQRVSSFFLNRSNTPPCLHIIQELVGVR